MGAATPSGSVLVELKIISLYVTSVHIYHGAVCNSRATLLLLLVLCCCTVADCLPRPCHASLKEVIVMNITAMLHTLCDVSSSVAALTP